MNRNVISPLVQKRLNQVAKTKAPQLERQESDSKDLLNIGSPMHQKMESDLIDTFRSLEKYTRMSNLCDSPSIKTKDIGLTPRPSHIIQDNFKASRGLNQKAQLQRRLKQINQGNKNTTEFVPSVYYSENSINSGSRFANHDRTFKSLKYPKIPTEAD